MYKLSLQTKISNFTLSFTLMSVRPEIPRMVMSSTLPFKSYLPGGANQKKTELKGEKLKRLISESGQSEALHRGPA